MLAALAGPVERALYRFQHRGLAVSTGLAYRMWSFLLRPGSGSLDAKTVRTLMRRFEALLERDLLNVGRGYYPRSLLYQMPLLGYVRTLPEAVLEAGRILRRRYRNQFDDVPPAARDGRYPLVSCSRIATSPWRMSAPRACRGPTALSMP